MARPPLGRAARCERCVLHLERCLCARLQPRAARTKVVVYMRPKEWLKPTNTGRLAPLLLEGAEVRLRGCEGAPLSFRDLLVPERRVMLLDPNGRVALGPELVAADPRPVTLLVPDGTWKQARRASLRHPELADALRVRLPEGGPSRYRLREARGPDRLATLEAIARALGVLEGPELEAWVQGAFEEVVARTLASRGVSSPSPS